MADYLTFSDVLTRAHVTRSLLMDLLRAGVVKPSVRASTGRGVHRRFSKADVGRVRLAGMLRCYGIPTNHVKGLVRELDRGRRGGADVVVIHALGGGKWLLRSLSVGEAQRLFLTPGGWASNELVFWFAPIRDLFS